VNDEPGAALRVARSLMARALLGVDGGVDPELGGLTLRPHQVSAVGRLLDIIASYRGALLADAVGLGKTYVALAIAREYRKSVVICPAALRGMWERAMTAGKIELSVISVEALSRGTLPTDGADLLIVDEAHHLRTPGTRRYEAVAHLARRSRLLLLSATPLHNSRRDLTSVLALFAGSGVNDWSDAALARLIVRRDGATADQRLPAVSGPHPLAPVDDDDCLAQILELPPAVPAADEGVAHALTTISLVHLWTSSRAALVASVNKRLARATALRDAVAAGHMPTAVELAAWRYADEALQLAFPLFAPETQPLDQHSLNGQLDRFVDGARALIDRCRLEPDPDASRVRLLRVLRRRHCGQRMVAFSQYAHTITALGRLMRCDPGIAIVTASGARIASGPISRDEVLSQFSAEAKPGNPVERIELLLTTDLLSEGIDLRGAAVIVHLDLPWNPARMEQRVGRSRRLGSRLETIYVYTFMPPTAAERLIELRHRLSAKVKLARRIVGGAFDPFTQAGAVSSPVGAGEALRAQIRDWIADQELSSDDGPVVAAAECPIRGWIAVVRIDGVSRMLGDFGLGIVEDESLLGEAIGQLGPPAPAGEAHRTAALRSIAQWIAARSATTGTDRQSGARRAVLDRLTLTVARAPRHRRPAIVAVAQKTRLALSGATGIGTEHVLATLARSGADDEAWLQSVATFGTLHAGDFSSLQSRDAIVAVILLGSISAGDATPE
jgi:superfamily II DNA or RNA helicase